jgi:hypothetical protein
MGITPAFQSGRGIEIALDKEMSLFMRKKKVQSIQKNKVEKLNTFTTFKERPSVEHKGNKSGQIDAADLFSLFTANIIREQVVFTR